MAGSLGFQALKTMSKQGKKVEASPSQSPALKCLSPIVETSTPNAGQGVNQSGVISKKRECPRPTADGEGVRVVDVSEGGSDHSAKKYRSIKEGHKRSSPKLNLEKLTTIDYEKYLQNPLAAVTDVCKSAADLFARWKQDEEERTTGNTLEARNLWL